jgi:hypothetical protein
MSLKEWILKKAMEQQNKAMEVIMKREQEKQKEKEIREARRLKEVERCQEQQNKS